jgi:coenzyme F420-0:L-glutamate ligase/coenzyme F420-1:gamma-L-glutamate ligase
VNLTVAPVTGVGEVTAGADLAALLVDAIGPGRLEPRDVLVVAHKVVSKAEGRVTAGTDRRRAALAESARVLRRVDDTIIAETRHGFVCANAGVDASNVPGDRLVLLPLDPDLSARRIRARVGHLTGTDVAVIVSDTFGRAWRVGQTNVAIGVAGMDPFIDYRGALDAHGRELSATLICVADEIAGAAEIVMGKTTQICAAVVRGVPFAARDASARAIVRPPEEDLFR